MIMAAADVKPIDTGPEIKSIRNPAKNSSDIHKLVYCESRS